MKVGVVANSIEHFKYSWPELSKGVSATGIKLAFAAGDGGRVSPGLVVEPLAGITRRPSATSVKAFSSIPSWVQRNDLDCVLVNTAMPAAQVRAAIGSRTPVVYFAHGLHWNSDSSLSTLHWRLIEKALVPRTSGAIVLNSDDENWFKRNAPGLPLLRLPFGVGVDVDRFIPAEIDFERGNNSKVSLLWIGEFSARKQPAKAIEVVSNLIQFGIDADLHMLGNGPDFAATKTYAEGQGVGGSVKFHGKVDPLPFYQQTDALIHTASWEGFPRVFLEALSTGKKVISFDAKGTRGIQGVINVPQGSAEAMAAEIRKLKNSGGFNSGQLLEKAQMSSLAAGERVAEFLKVVVCGQQ